MRWAMGLRLTMASHTPRGVLSLDLCQPHWCGSDTLTFVCVCSSGRGKKKLLTAVEHKKEMVIYHIHSIRTLAGTEFCAFLVYVDQI